MERENISDYTGWSPEKLIDRVTVLERQLSDLNAKYATGHTLSPSSSIPSPRLRPKNPRVNREFDPAKYSTRLIALKFAYLGQSYNGFEHHAKNKTPLPTVEEMLWKALHKGRLIFPTETQDGAAGEVSFEGCEYSKCGRTDKGVSAFGQVIGIRVRSNKPLGKNSSSPKSYCESSVDGIEAGSSSLAQGTGGGPRAPSLDDVSNEGPLAFHPINDEIPYIQVLNRLLPPDIRMLAWCPSPPPNFSARFSCTERRYRYFFTQPVFNPTAGPTGIQHGLTSDPSSGTKRREGWLDIAAMQAAAQRFEGLHDFRNFCKVDPSKQIENFERRIFHAEIREVAQASEPASYISGSDFLEYNSPLAARSDAQDFVPSTKSTPKIYAFVLHGSGFLWHQVRHMIAILFLIGQGLETPELISHLLDVATNPQKPIYEMAEDAPLVLWDCIFPSEDSNDHEDGLEWVYVGDTIDAGVGNAALPPAKGNGKFGLGGVVDDMWKIWRARKIDEVLAGVLLDVVAAAGNDSVVSADGGGKRRNSNRPNSQKVYHGGDSARLVGKYVPILERERMEDVAVVNRRYAVRKGFDHLEGRGTGFRRVRIEGVEGGEEADFLEGR